MRTGSQLARVLLALVAAALVASLVSLVYLRFVGLGDLSPQSEHMLERSQSLKSALGSHEWGPGYPLLLFSVRKIGLPLEAANLLLLLASLALAYFASKWGLPNISPIWLPLFYAACAFNYYNSAQFTAEPMIVPLSLLVLILLAAYVRRQQLLALVALSLCCALLFISRYETLLRVMPIVVFHLVIALRTKLRMMLLHLIVFGVIALGPASAVLHGNYRATGHLTGIPRLGWSSRVLKPQNEYFRTSTGLDDNVRLTAKTYFLDFVSPVARGSHTANKSPYVISAIEAGIVALFVVVLGISGWAVVRYLRRQGSTTSALRALYNGAPMSMLALEFWLIFLLFVIVAWAMGAIDPIYTRHMFPSYIYFIFVMFSAYALLKAEAPDGRLRYPAVVLSAGIVALNMAKIAHFLTVPN